MPVKVKSAKKILESLIKKLKYYNKLLRDERKTLDRLQKEQLVCDDAIYSLSRCICANKQFYKTIHAKWLLDYLYEANNRLESDIDASSRMIKDIERDIFLVKKQISTAKKNCMKSKRSCKVKVKPVK